MIEANKTFKIFYQIQLGMLRMQHLSLLRYQLLVQVLVVDTLLILIPSRLFLHPHLILSLQNKLQRIIKQSPDQLLDMMISWFWRQTIQLVI